MSENHITLSEYLLTRDMQTSEPFSLAQIVLVGFMCSFAFGLGLASCVRSRSLNLVLFQVQQVERFQSLQSTSSQTPTTHSTSTPSPLTSQLQPAIRAVSRHKMQLRNKLY